MSTGSLRRRSRSRRQSRRKVRYDYFYKPFGEHVNIPSSLARPPLPKVYTYKKNFWRCFNEECQARVDTLPDGMNHGDIHWSAIWNLHTTNVEHKVCEGCSTAKHQCVDGDDQPELRCIQFEDFSNDWRNKNSSKMEPSRSSTMRSWGSTWSDTWAMQRFLSSPTLEAWRWMLPLAWGLQ